MNVTLTNFIETLKNPGGCFRTLTGIWPATDEFDIPEFRETPLGIQCRVMNSEGEFVMTCFRKHDPALIARLKEISLFSSLLGDSRLADMVVLENELTVFDDLGNHRVFDVMLESIPDGTTMDKYLGDAVHSGRNPAEILASLASLAGWLAGNNLCHSSISTGSITVAPDGELYLTYLISTARGEAVEDIKALAAISLYVYLICCDSRFGRHILKDIKEPAPHPGVSPMTEALAGIIDSETPQLLRILLNLITTGTSPEDVKDLLEGMNELAQAPPVTIPALTQMLDELGHEAAVHFAPTGGNINAKYSEIGEMHEMLMAAFDGNEWRYLDKDGKVVIEGGYTHASNFYEGLALVEVNSRFGVINRNGEYVISPLFDDISIDETGNLLIVTQEGVSAIYDREGEAVTGLVYDRILPVSENLLLARINGHYGYLNRDGSVAIDFIYDDAYSFRNGKAVVSSKGRKYVIDREGREIDEVLELHQ